MVASGPGVGVTADPLAIDSPHFVQVVVPVGPKPERVADEGPHDGAGNPVRGRLAVGSGRNCFFDRGCFAFRRHDSFSFEEVFLLLRQLNMPPRASLHMISLKMTT